MKFSFVKQVAAVAATCAIADVFRPQKRKKCVGKCTRPTNIAVIGRSARASAA